MKALKLTALVLAVSLLVSMSTAKGAAVWNRQIDWGAPTPGPAVAPSNPSPDGLGSLTYGHVWSEGTGLDDPDVASRWYAQPGTAMEWDPSWIVASGGKKLWAVTDNQAANIRWDLMTQVTSGHTATFAPMVQWHNPSNETMNIEAGGMMRLEWYGDHADTDPTVDVVVARVGGAHHGAKEADSFDAPGKELHESQRHNRLSALGRHGCDIEALGHGSIPPPLLRPG